MSLCCRTGFASAVTMAAFSLAMMSFGVPLGAHIPCQTDSVKPGTPASSMVGISGARTCRLVAATARTLMLLLRNCASVFPKIDLPCDQILHRGRRPAIRHESNSRVSAALEISSEQAAPSGKHARRGFVRIRLEPDNQILEVPYG